MRTISTCMSSSVITSWSSATGGSATGVTIMSISSDVIALPCASFTAKVNVS